MVEQYFIENSNGMRVGILNYGGIITQLSVPTTHGNRVNTILSYNHLDDYLTDTHYVGATIGRYANRIGNGQFALDSLDCQLSVNELENNNHLHGGFQGFNTKIWSMERHTPSEVTLFYESHDGEEGYPGILQVWVTYRVLEENALQLTYTAKTNKTTIVNLSNHSYFNLSGDPRQSICEHTIQVNTGEFTPLDKRNLPDGTIASVSNTVFDLREGRKVGEVMDDIVNTNYAFVQAGNENVPMAVLTDSKSCRTLTISSSYPGMQLYFGSFLGGRFSPYQGICLEPQYFPNSPNNDHFPSAKLEPDEMFKHSIKYAFSNF